MANAFRQKIAIAVAAAQAKKNQTDSTPQGETNFWYQKKPSIINVEMKALAEKSNQPESKETTHESVVVKESSKEVTPT